YEYSAPDFLNLKFYGGPPDCDPPPLHPSHNIKNPDPAAPITDIDAAGGCIVSNVVGVIGKLYALDELERRSIEHIAGAAFRIGDVDLVKFRDETNTLRLIQSGDAMDTLARTKV